MCLNLKYYQYLLQDKTWKILSDESIDLNDFVNGVYLPHTTNVKNNKEAYHRKTHTEQYYKNVYNRLALNAGNKQAI